MPGTARGVKKAVVDWSLYQVDVFSSFAKFGYRRASTVFVSVISPLVPSSSKMTSTTGVSALGLLASSTLSESGKISLLAFEKKTNITRTTIGAAIRMSIRFLRKAERKSA